MSFLASKGFSAEDIHKDLIKKEAKVMAGSGCSDPKLIPSTGDEFGLPIAEKSPRVEQTDPPLKTADQPGQNDYCHSFMS